MLRCWIFFGKVVVGRMLRRIFDFGIRLFVFFCMVLRMFEVLFLVEWMSLFFKLRVVEVL